MINVEELIKETADRIAKLRTGKNVSARDMSLTMGQGRTYINDIENRKTKPSLEGLFIICEYLNISPKDFFDTSNPNPEKIDEIVEDLKRLPPDHLQNVAKLIKGLIR